MTKEVNLAHVENITFHLARELMSYDEPIPDFTTRFPGILERCLLSPFQTFEKKSLYQGLVEKAAALFYFLIKGHPFQNGNKRIAVATILYFLYQNGKWLEVNNLEFYNFAVWAAGSPPRAKDEVIQATANFIKRYLTNL